MSAIRPSALKSGLRSAAMSAVVRALPFTQHAPVVKWLAFSLVTFEQLEEMNF